MGKSFFPTLNDKGWSNIVSAGFFRVLVTLMVLSCGFTVLKADSPGSSFIPWMSPSSLSASLVEPNSVKLSWTENSYIHVSEWVVAYRAKGESVYDSIIANTNPYILTGLAYDTEYSIKVRPLNEESIIRWSDDIQIGTCLVPTMEEAPVALSASRNLGNSATLTWFGMQSDYNLSYRWIYDDVVIKVGDPRTVAGHFNSEGFFSKYNISFVYPYAAQGVFYPVTTLDNSRICFDACNVVVTNEGLAGSTNWDLKVVWVKDDKEECVVLSTRSFVLDHFEIDLPSGISEVGFVVDAFCPVNWSDYLTSFNVVVYNIAVKNREKDGEWVTVNNVESPYTLSDIPESCKCEWKVQGKESGKTTQWSSSVFQSTRHYRIDETMDVDDIMEDLVFYVGLPYEFEFTRSFSKDVASTICLPFPMKSVSGGSLYVFSDVIYDENEGWVAIMQSANLATSPTVTGRPYLFMPSDDGEVTFRGIVESIPDIPFAGKSIAKHAGGDGGTWTFKGTYEYIKWNKHSEPFYGFAARQYDGDGYSIEPGDFVKSGDGASVPPFRCYLTYNGTGLRGQMRGTASDTDVLPGSIKVVLLGSGGTVTAVGSMETETGYVKIDTWFDMNGRELPAAPVESGLYIHNGRKEMIR